MKETNSKEALSVYERVKSEVEAQGKQNIVYSITGDGELLIYHQYEKGSFNNIIIDNDGDIEWLVTPNERRLSHNEYFDYWNVTDGLITELVSKL